jgi:flavin reductase
MTTSISTHSNSDTSVNQRPMLSLVQRGESIHLNHRAFTGREPAAREDFLAAMGRRVSTVNLVSTDGSGGRFGLTVTSMSSVSAEPPVVMIGINRKSPLCDAINVNRCFVVNVLSVQQQHLANSFAGFHPEGRDYDFELARWMAGVTRAPVLEDGTATFECSLLSHQDVGCHRLFMGSVLAAGHGAEAALCYGEHTYKQARAIA